jgi:cytochrome c oxidase subunit 2
VRGASAELRRFLLIWLGLSAVCTPLVAIFAGSIVPPGDQGDAASGQVLDLTVGSTVATPVFLLIVTFLAYTLVRFRQKESEIAEGPRVYGHRGLQMTWILASAAILVGLVAFDVVRLVLPGAAGSGQGPTPLSPLGAGPSGAPVLPVQVIGQQWQFTYRYPTYGGVETPRLVLPVDRTVEFHVTSLDVIHAFWAYGLGVKADANPGVDNIAYVIPRRMGTFAIRCAELCGLWHGYMFDTGRVVTPTSFATWIAGEQRLFAPIKRDLPPYSRTYLPQPRRRAG